MIGTDIDVFLSCSFAPDDAAVNELVRAICSGMGLVCTNVDAAFAAVPPEKAKEYISKSSGLIAIATTRDRLSNGEFVMPSAVREEVSIAYGLGKPILILGEVGVRFDGFMNNYGTRLPFSRDQLTDPSFLEKLVLSIHTFRGEVAAAENAVSFAGEYISENTRRLVSLDYHSSTYRWTISTTKRLVFEKALQRDISSSVWPRVPMPITPLDAPSPRWSVSINSSSKPFEVETAIRNIAADRIEMSIRFRPDPQPGDYIDFTRTFQTQYFNPLFSDDLPVGSPPAVVIDSRSYPISDGIVLPERTKRLHSQYRFPAKYGLRKEDIAIFVASHSFNIDYLAPWELKRVASEVESFGSELSIDLRVEDPMPRHIYGIAWFPPRRNDKNYF